MKIILNDDEQILEVNTSSVEEIIDYIFQLKEEDKILSHVVIDEQTVYTNLNEYLENNNQIDTIQVVTKSFKDYINETLGTAEEYLTNAIPHLKDLITAFYNNPSEEDWSLFTDFTEGLMWLMNMIANIDGLKIKPNNWQEYITVYKAIEEHIPIIMDDTLEYLNKIFLNSNKDNILEIGTAVGYSSICFSKFLSKKRNN